MARRNFSNTLTSRRLGRRAIWLVAGALVLAGGAFVLGVGGAGGLAARGDRAIGDVSVAGIPLEGETREQARRTLKEESSMEEIRLIRDGSKQSLTLDTRTVEFDAAATAQKAYEVGGDEGLLERIGERLSSGTETTSVEPVVRYEREELVRKIERAASATERDPESATVGMNGTSVQPTEARGGYEVDGEATAVNVARAIENLEPEATISGRRLEPEVTTQEARDAAERAREAVSNPLTLTALGERWTLSPAEVASAVELQHKDGKLAVGLRKGGLGLYLGGMYETVNRPAEGASYEISGDNISTTPSSVGRKIEDAELFEALESGLFEGKHRYEVPVAGVEPEMSTERAERLKPTQLIGEYRTPYENTGDSSEARVRNLKKSSGAVDEVTVAPGEVFSFNELASGLDYEAAKVIVDGQVATEAGGGLCQVSSTLYNAANDAGLEIVERAPHSAELPYIRPGLDATVWFGAGGSQELDMKFKNTTDSNILIRETVREDGYVYAEIWGRPTGKEVELSSEQVSSGPDSTRWITYKTVEEDGETVSKSRMHRDTYEPLKGEDGDPVPNSEAAPADW